MLIVPDPPADVMLDVVTFRVNPHRCVEGPLGVKRVVDEEPQPVANALSRSIEGQISRTPPRWVMAVH
jgi:hypothetical protein